MHKQLDRRATACGVFTRDSRQPSSGAAPGSPQSLSDGGIIEHCRCIRIMRLEIEPGGRHVMQGHRRAPLRIGQCSEGFVRTVRDRSSSQGSASARDFSPPHHWRTRVLAAARGRFRHGQHQQRLLRSQHVVRQRLCTWRRGPARNPPSGLRPSNPNLQLRVLRTSWPNYPMSAGSLRNLPSQVRPRRR